MYKCRIKLNVGDFEETTGEYGIQKISATLTDCIDISASPRPDGKPVFVLDPPVPGEEQQLHIHVPQGYKNGVQILFQLPTPERDPSVATLAKTWVILGIAFKAQNDSKCEVAQNEFPIVTINRDTSASEMGVIDMCDQIISHNYPYGILLQRVSDGKIGIFDPGIDNDTPNSPR